MEKAYIRDVAFWERIQLLATYTTVMGIVAGVICLLADPSPVLAAYGIGCAVGAVVWVCLMLFGEESPFRRVEYAEYLRDLNDDFPEEAEGRTRIQDIKKSLRFWNPVLWPVGLAWMIVRLVFAVVWYFVSWGLASLGLR